ncbi:MAG: hypothetical protein ABJP96_05640 [Erythrobacter sp.]
MSVTWKDLAFEPGVTFAQGVAENWEWMTDRKDLTPFLCSKLGDAFCTDVMGQVHWLDCSGGMVQWITPSRATFDAECEKNGAKVDLWFGPKLIEKLHNAGQVAGPGEAYMFLTLPIFEECEFEPHNFKILPANEVFIGLSDMHKLYTDIPDGGRTRHKIVD